jgi:hypothetical protein
MGGQRRLYSFSNAKGFLSLVQSNGGTVDRRYRRKDLLSRRNFGIINALYALQAAIRSGDRRNNGREPPNQAALIVVIRASRVAAQYWRRNGQSSPRGIGGDDIKLVRFIEKLLNCRRF